MVYNERMEARDPRQFVQKSRAADPRNASEVVVTLNNFHYTRDVNHIKKLLGDIVTPYLVGIMKVHGVLGQQCDNECLNWVPCGAMNNWRLLTPNEEVSKYLCKQLVEKAVMFQGMTGHVQFRSKYHALAKTDVQHYLENKVILDVTHQHEAQGQSMPSAAPEPRESAADQLAMPATPRSATPRPTTPGAIQAPFAAQPSGPA